MSDSNGTTPKLADLQEQTKLARARTRLARARREMALSEAAGDGQLGVGWGEYLNPFGFRYDSFGGLWLPLGLNLGSVAAKKDGRNYPFVQSDADLDRQRGMARWLTTKNDLAIGILENLTNFTVKKGYEWDTRPTAGHEQDARAIELARQVKRVIDDHAEHNKLARRERSAFRRAVRDGDAITRHFAQHDGRTLVRFVAAEQLRDPGDRGPEASLGIECEEGDVETPLYYHVTYDGTCFDRVPAAEISHLKRNVDEETKRGLSDFFSAGDTLDDVHKLLRNMRKGGGVLAAMAWIEEFEAATRDQMAAHQGGLRDLNRPQVEHPVTGRRIDYQQMEPGTVVRVQRGKKYLPPPLAGNTTNFTGIIQACLRSVGVRWNFPEYMTSGDASNANMASLLVSGSPTVNAIECQQADFGDLYLRWRWIAVRNACAAGLIRADFAEVQALVDIHYTAPLVAISNEREQATIDHEDMDRGVLSIQSRRARRKLDGEQEKKNLAEEPPTRVPGRSTDLDSQGNPVNVGKDGEPDQGKPDAPDARGSVGGLQATLSSILALQTAVYKGEIPRLAAIENAEIAIGFTKEQAARLFPEVPPEKTADDGQGDQQPPGPPPTFGESFSASHLREAYWIEANLQEAREKGVPFQGPSGRWFVVNDQGRTVPAKNPNAKGQGGGKKGGKGGDGGDKAKPKKLTTDEAHAALKGYQGRAATTEDVANLTKTLLGVTVEQVKELRKREGLTKGSGRKEELIKALVAKVTAGGEEPKPEPGPEPKPEPQLEPKPEEETLVADELTDQEVIDRYKQTNPDHPVAKAIRADTNGYNRLLRVAEAIKAVPGDPAVIEELRAKKNAAYKEYVDSLQERYPDRRKFQGKGAEAAYKAAVAEYNAKVKRGGEANERRKQLEDQIAGMVAEAALRQQKIREAVREALKSDSPMRLTFDDKAEGMDPRHKADCLEARDWLEDVTGGDLRAHVTLAVSDTGRAFYRSDKMGGAFANEVRLGSHEAPQTMVHELGHMIEERKPGLRQRINAFLAYRCGDEKPVRLNTLPGGEGYGDHEVGRKDNFDRAFTEGDAYYVGKVYKGGIFNREYASEVLSMGLEKLYVNAQDFIEKDPEYAHFVIDCLRYH